LPRYVTVLIVTPIDGDGWLVASFLPLGSLRRSAGAEGLTYYCSAKEVRGKEQRLSHAVVRCMVTCQDKLSRFTV